MNIPIHKPAPLRVSIYDWPWDSQRQSGGILNYVYSDGFPVFKMINDIIERKARANSN